MLKWLCLCGAPLNDFIVRRCPACRRATAYDPQQHALRAVAPQDFVCANRRRRCNWLAESRGGFCFSCRLTKTIPPQNTAAGRAALRRFDRAKRQLVASLLRQQLLPRHLYLSRGRRLEINLLQDKRDNAEVSDDFVTTGHFNGVISINAREADPLRVEETRQQFREKYRTLLGSLRHESGHYFWLALVAENPERLLRFRALFGDERADYQQALQAYYAGKPGESRDYVSEYARMHPHEDWAETWAHYLHMEGAVAVATRAGMRFADDGASFRSLLPRWRQVSDIANALSTALGHRPSYPFAATDEVAPKLEFVHNTIAEERAAANAAAQQAQ